MMFKKIALTISLVLSLLGCNYTSYVPVSLESPQVSISTTQSAFVIKKGIVSKILPLDTKGLPHQNFVIRSDRMYEVNNDTQYGTFVPDLRVGSNVEIKGQIYRNGNKWGLHFTHRKSYPGNVYESGGYILYLGKTYE